MNKTILAIALATSMGANAQVTNISNSEFAESCEGAVKFSAQHAHETDLGRVLDAQWEIMTSEKVGDMEKLIHTTMFLMYQRASYAWEAVKEESGGEEGWNNKLYDICLDALNSWEIVEKGNRPSTHMEIESIY
jgi:hypothetical protein